MSPHSPSPATDPATAAASGATASRWAWGVCWLMFASTVLNYMDRQAIALVRPQIQREFGIDYEGFGWVLTAFGITYALFQVLAGFVVDRTEVRRIYAGAVGFWSLAAIATAFAPTLGILIALRALLGVGESFNWPAALRVTATILPPKDRSLGNGIFNSGAAVGAVLTPLLVPLLTTWFGWRPSFLVIGALGFVWVAVWLLATGRKWQSTSEPITARDGAPRSVSPRARLAFGTLAGLAVATSVAAYLQPAPVAITTERLRPTIPGQLAAWRVEPGAKVERGKTVLAELAYGDARLELIAPHEGKVGTLLVAAGATVAPGDRLLTVDDAAGPADVHLEAVRATTPARLDRWRVEPGAAVPRGAVLAEVAVGDTPMQVLAAHGATLDGSPAAAGSAVAVGRPLGVLGVHGFDQKAWGLPGVWWGVAVLMFGALLAARLLPMADLGERGLLADLGTIVRLRRFWLLVLVTCSINVCWHFLVNWVPTYLQTDRKLAYVAGGLLTALVFLMADAGNLLGGATSRAIVARGVEPWRARIRVMARCALLIAGGALVGVVPEGGSWDVVIVGLLCLMALGAAAFMANYFAFCQEVSPAHTGLVVGYLGGLGNLLAAGFNPIAGRVKDVAQSFGPVFLVVGLIPFVGLAALALGWGGGATPPATAGSRERSA